MPLSSLFPFFSGEGSIKFVSFLRGIPQECLCFGSSSFPGPYLAEDIPAGILLCDYRNWHQPTRCFTGEQRCLHDLPRNSLILAPALYFHLSCSLSEDSVNSCLREEMHCIFIQKTGEVVSVTQPNRWQQLLLLKTNPIILTCRSLALTLCM